MCIGCVFDWSLLPLPFHRIWQSDVFVRSFFHYYYWYWWWWCWCCCGCFFFSNFKIFALLLCILHSCGDFLAFWIMHLTSSTIDRASYNYRKPHVDSIICVSMLGYRFRITKNGNQMISRIMMCTEQMHIQTMLCSMWTANLLYIPMRKNRRVFNRDANFVPSSNDFV